MTYCNPCQSTLPVNQTIYTLRDLICDYFQVTEAQLRHKSRKVELVRPRHVFFYIANVILGYNHRETAAVINRDGTMVVHGREAIRAEMQYNQQLKNVVEHLIGRVKP